MKFEHRKNDELTFRKVKDFAPADFLEKMTESDRETETATHFSGENGLALMEIVDIPNGKATLHSHDQEEIFYIVEGELIFGNRVCSAGDSINIKAGVQYTFRVGDKGCRYLKFTARQDPSFNIA